jgi:hypothetical protein
MKGGARPGGMDHTVYDEKVVKDGKRFNPGELSLEARSYLDGLASDSYQTRLELSEGNPDAMFPKCTCQRGNSGCNSKTHNHWLLGSFWRYGHCGERIHVHPDELAIDDHAPICEYCRRLKGGFKPKRKKSKKRKKQTKRKKKQTKRKKR